MITNSVADCLISLKFGTEFDHVTSDLLQMFKVDFKGQGQGHSVKTSSDCQIIALFQEIGVAQSNGDARNGIRSW